MPESYPVYASMNSLTVVGNMTEEKIRAKLPANQVRELDLRVRESLPYHFFYHRSGQLMIGHTPDPLGGLG